MNFSTWDYPGVIVVALLFSMVVTAWLFRVGRAKVLPDFECVICGRKQIGGYAKQWRFCPYCGAPRDGKQIKSVSILDVPLKK